MSSNEPSNGISPADAQFVFECLRNLDDDRQVSQSSTPSPHTLHADQQAQVNLGQVASALGYSNVASVGNRLRALRKTYGFENLVGKNTALSAKTDGAAAATGNKPVNKSDSAPKRGRPARVKSDTLPASSSTEVATRVEVNIGGDEEVKSAKRKREDEPTTDVKLENTSEQQQQQQQVKKRGRKPASATSTSASTSTTTPMSLAMPPPASIPFTGQMNGSGKANSRTVHFNRMRYASKRRKKQEDSSSSTSSSSSTNRPSEYIYHIAAETIREARRQRRRARRGSVKSKSGLKLVFKVARMRSRSWLASLSVSLMDEEVADLTLDFF